MAHGSRNIQVALSAFGNTRKNWLFGVFENPFFYYSFILFPYFLLIFSFISVGFICFTWNSVAWWPRDPGDYNFNFIILGCNAVTSLLMGAFFKDLRELLFNIHTQERMLSEIPQAMRADAAITEDFISKSTEDLKALLDYPNSALKYANQNFYLTETIILFISTLWALVDVPFGFWCPVWVKIGPSIGITLELFLFIFVACHGIPIIIQIFLRLCIKGDCKRAGQAAQKWKDFFIRSKNQEKSSFEKEMDKLLKKLSI